RVTQADKGECAAIARQWGKDYWDGDRKYGYGGYHYDGRWAPVAQKMIERYKLTDKSSILDVGCGKGFLLYELQKLLPGAKVRGLDISEYGIAHSKEEIRDKLVLGNCNKLPFADKEFDFVYSIMTFHNLYIYDLFASVRELQRVSKGEGFIGLESYRNEKEKANLLYWQLTCEAFFTPKEWVWIYDQCGFTGDHEFLYFE
ncbi:MAG: methyltransferase domain-containing protein, partial [Deltaproteobacteria bacterium]|nr:methyltransferase domain-containing protein [Deltaproteobacteria bacterium]